MGDERSEPRRRPHDDEMTRVDAPQARERSAPPPGPIPEAEPTRPMLDRPLPQSEETLRIRPDQINRRALPFKKSGGERRRRDSEPETDPQLVETGEMPRAPAPQPALPFEDASQSLPPDPAPPYAPADLAQSVWTREAVINAADLPSALAPQSAPIHAAPPARKGVDAITLITMLGVVLVLLMCALAILL